jgi:uncharacterized protein YjbI with pentapeptide repeats
MSRSAMMGVRGNIKDLPCLCLAVSAICCLVTGSICASAEELKPELKDNTCSAVITGTANGVSVQCADKVASAQATLDRVLKERDGSVQGQNAAIEFLLSQGYKFNSVNWNGINLSAIHLRDAKMSKARLHLVDLSLSELRNVNLAGAGLRFSNLDKAAIYDSNLSGIYSPFVHGVGLTVTNSDVSKTNLSGSVLSGSKFDGVNLSGTSFTFSDLQNAQFINSDLTQTDFQGAILTGATFVGSRLSNTAFDGAVTAGLKMSNEELQGRCVQQMTSDHPAFDYYMMILEQWPSNKYDSGYEFEKLVEDRGALPYKARSSLPKCSQKATAVGFDSEFPTTWHLGIDRDLLDNDDRRETVVNQVQQLVSYVEKAIKEQ